jgi:translation initiation factor 2 alpha subunit (eIF-2alpha)
MGVIVIDDRLDNKLEEIASMLGTDEETLIEKVLTIFIRKFEQNYEMLDEENES